MISLVVIAALVALLIYAIFVGRCIRLSEFASYRGRASQGQIVLSLLSSLLGGWMFFGLSAIGYEAGVVGYIVGVAYCVGLVLLAAAVPRIKRAIDETRSDTMDEYVGHIYGRPAQIAVSAINLFFFLAVLAAQFIALAAFLSIFSQYDRGEIFYVAAVVVITYTAAAGFKGVLFTDVWQFWVIAVSVLGFSAIAFSELDIGHVLESLPPAHLVGTAYGSVFLVGTIVFLPATMLVRTDLWQRIASARDAGSVRRGLAITAPILLVFYVLLTNIGIFARVYLEPGVRPDTSGLTFILATLQALDGPVATPLVNAAVLFFSLGILAALLSTIDTNLNVVSVALSKLFAAKSWRDFDNEKESKQRSNAEIAALRATRVITAAIGLVGLVVARALPDIVDLIVSAGAILLVFVPAVVGALRKWSVARWGAVASVTVGYAGFLTMTAVTKNPKISFVPGVVIAAIVYVVAVFVERARLRRKVAVD